MIALAPDRRTSLGALCRVVLLCMLLLGAAHVFAQSAITAVPGLRLPRDIVPLAYDAKLHIDPAVDVFTGTIDITVRVLEPTDLVWLNAKKLAVSEVRAVALAAPDEEIAGTTVPGSEEVTGFKFAKVLPAGEVRITISYTGHNDSTLGVGLFRQKDGERWYSVTQLEAMDARRVFPCFDEPDRKATWKLTLTVPGAARAFANMPVESERIAAPGWREFVFVRTPLLPSYLIAFAIGEFEAVDAGRAGKNNTPISIIVPKGRAAEAAYAASHTGAVLAAAERFFGMPYPFPKLDLLAYPKSTFGGAMENAGLITFSGRYLLAKPEEVSPLFEQRFIGIAAHEISHMWFGDYVTMTWWNDLWLNESFASWLGSAITVELRPDWPRGGRSRQRTKAIEFDRLTTARRIRQPIDEYSDVFAAFDDITYAKGETVIAMFEQWLGPEKFREGVRRYMAKYAWGNATAEDFFASLAATDDAIVPAFRGFVERPGVPLLDVALDCSGPPSLKVTQQRFVPVGLPAQPGARWTFPACFDFGDVTKSRQTCTLIHDEQQVVALPVTACPQWVVANRNGLGYYLPRLTPALYGALARTERVIGPADFDPILADVEVLARSGGVAYQDVLPLAARQAASTDARVALRAYDLAESVPEAMVDPINVERYAAWLRHHFGDRARALGWIARRGEPAEVLRLREVAVPLVADRGQDTALARKAVQLAQRWLEHRSAIPPESRKTVLVGAARASGKDAARLFDALAQIGSNTTDANERDDIDVALGSFRDAALLTRALDASLVRGPDGRERASEVVRQALEDAQTRPVALRWLSVHGAQLFAITPPERQALWPVFAKDACTGAERKQIVALFETRASEIDAGKRRYQTSMEKIDGCLALRRAQQAPLNAYLANVK